MITCCLHKYIKQVIAIPTQFVELFSGLLPADFTEQMARLLREYIEILDTKILKNL